mgnify:FL=1|jgi:hypothetical protein|nr:MAG TPA: hypothetical protein [Caudoviricetes sp.]DAV07152.1 MAG TPA: hypothetical protein [Caudoviricetes sp.]
MFTVEEIIEMFVDPEMQVFSIWSNEKEKVIYTGFISDVPDELLQADVTSIDNVFEDCKGIITFNIN